MHVYTRTHTHTSSKWHPLASSYAEVICLVLRDTEQKPVHLRTDDRVVDAHLEVGQKPLHSPGSG